MALASSFIAKGPLTTMAAPAPTPRVTFGIIVLNGEPFVRYNLRALYPFAHEIIVVEGAAAPTAAAIAGPDGHSADGTLETLRSFKAAEDPDDKIVIVTAEDEGHPDGFWPGEKDEQSEAYAKRATGDYLWQIDIDEFYRAGDMRTVLDMLRDDPDITAVSVRQITFWGGFDCTADGWYLRHGADIFHRLFKWGPGFRYTTHRPPTVEDRAGRDLREIKWISGAELARHGILLYHYALLFPEQAEQKAKYYAAGPWGSYADGIMRWAGENFLGPIHQPFHVHNVHTHPSWLERFSGIHPEQAVRMKEDVDSGRLQQAFRDNGDVDVLLGLPGYRFGRWVLRRLAALSGWRYFPKGRFSRLLSHVQYDPDRRRLVWR